VSRVSVEFKVPCNQDRSRTMFQRLIYSQRWAPGPLRIFGRSENAGRPWESFTWVP
jgi:hypothetical protein